MATDFGLTIRETTIPKTITLCGQTTQNATTTPNTSISLTFPGTPPFEVHSTLTGLDGHVSRCIWHELPSNLTSNTFVWTPIALGRRPTPEIQGNETDYQVIISDGDSLVWVAKQLQENQTESDAGYKTFVSGNYTIMSSELAAQQAANASNGALSSVKPISLKAFAVVGMLVVALMCL